MGPVLPRLDPYPLWLRIPLALFVAVLVPVYWHRYGPGNFLWFSDIALFAVLISLWTGYRLPYSMIAVGVLPLEIVWTLDFLSGANLIGLTTYMFDDDLPLALRALSLFHLALATIVIGMLIVQGYDRRAIWTQTVFAWFVLLATYWLTAPKDNVNWVHGLGDGGMLPLPQPWYLLVYMALLPLVVIAPMHLALRRLFRS